MGHPVEGHFDGHHVRVLARLLQKPQQGPHALIGEAQHPVALPDLLRHGDQRVHVGGILGHPAGVEQLRPVPEQIPHRAEEGEIQRRAAGKQVLFGQPQAGAQPVPDGVGQLAPVVQLHRLKPLPAAYELFHALAVLLRRDVVGLAGGVVHVDVRAAHQADEHRALYLIMDKELGEEAGDQLLHQDKPPGFPRQGHQPPENALAAGDDAHALPAVFGFEHGHGVDLLVAQEGEGLLAPDDLGGEQGQHAGGEILLQEGLGFVRQGVKAAQLYPLGGQLPQQALADPVPVRQQLAGFVQHGGGLLAGGHPGLIVRHPHVEGVQQHPHPDHVELVQIALEDGGEVQPLAQGIGGVLRLLQHPAVELEPGQLPVPVAACLRPGGQAGMRLIAHLDHIPFFHQCTIFSPAAQDFFC